MLRWPVAMLLAACNQVFGVQHTHIQDGAIPFFDGTPDAPFGCPAMAAPAFAPGFTQVVTSGACEAYSVSRTAGIAVANCTVTVDSAQLVIMQGPVDADGFLPLVWADQASRPATIEPKLAPEGNELWVPEAVTAGTAINVYTPVGDPITRTWGFSYTATVVADTGILLGTPSRQGAPRRVMYLSSSGTMHELAEQTGGSWTDTAITYPKLSAPNIASAPNLTPDGLHVVFAGALFGPAASSGVIDLYRASADVPFDIATTAVLQGPPAASEAPLMTQDCSRVYFSGLGSVFYVTEQL